MQQWDDIPTFFWGEGAQKIEQWLHKVFVTGGYVVKCAKDFCQRLQAQNVLNLLNFLFLNVPLQVPNIAQTESMHFVTFWNTLYWLRTNNSCCIACKVGNKIIINYIRITILWNLQGMEMSLRREGHLMLAIYGSSPALNDPSPSACHLVLAIELSCLSDPNSYADGDLVPGGFSPTALEEG